jgi:hypothetical protein
VRQFQQILSSWAGKSDNKRERGHKLDHRSSSGCGRSSGVGGKFGIRAFRFLAGFEDVEEDIGFLGTTGVVIAPIKSPAKAAAMAYGRSVGVLMASVA